MAGVPEEEAVLHEEEDEHHLNDEGVGRTEDEGESDQALVQHAEEDADEVAPEALGVHVAGDTVPRDAKGLASASHQEVVGDPLAPSIAKSLSPKHLRKEKLGASRTRHRRPRGCQARRPWGSSIQPRSRCRRLR